MNSATVHVPTDTASANRAPAYDVATEHVIAPSARWFRAGWKATDKFRRLPSTPRGWTAVVVVPDSIDYIYLATSAAIADLVRQAGRVVVRGSDARAVDLLAGELRRAAGSW